jgi:hypothetical protein
LLARVQFPIIGVDFLRHFKWILRRAAWLTLSPLSYYLQYPACAASPNQSMAAATTAGRAAPAQVHAQRLALAPLPG